MTLVFGVVCVFFFFNLAINSIKVLSNVISDLGTLYLMISKFLYVNLVNSLKAFYNSGVYHFFLKIWRSF